MNETEDTGGSMSFPAKYEGRCPECGERIHVGDVIESTGQSAYAHVDCDAAVEETELDRDAKRPVCPVCFLVGPCECEEEA